MCPFGVRSIAGSSGAPVSVPRGCVVLTAVAAGCFQGGFETGIRIGRSSGIDDRMRWGSHYRRRARQRRSRVRGAWACALQVVSCASPRLLVAVESHCAAVIVGSLPKAPEEVQEQRRQPAAGNNPGHVSSCDSHIFPPSLLLGEL